MMPGAKPMSHPKQQFSLDSDRPLQEIRPLPPLAQVSDLVFPCLHEKRVYCQRDSYYRVIPHFETFLPFGDFSPSPFPVCGRCPTPSTPRPGPRTFPVSSDPGGAVSRPDNLRVLLLGAQGA
jgi:hypothetical protein